MYLENIDWDKKEFNNKQLEAMIAASCLRFLFDIEDLAFILGLSKEISKKYKPTMKLSLQYSTEILNELATKLKNNEINKNDSKKIREIINEAQEVITGRGLID